MDFDRTLIKMYNHSRITYGLLFGNECIVFIKTGAGGSIRGYQDKYLQMAHRIRERIGATVICASNPDCEHVNSDESIIRTYAQNTGFQKYELRYIGVSDGAYRILPLAARFSQSKVLLGINTSFVDPGSLIKKLNDLPHIRKILVYGTEDDDYNVIYPFMATIKCDLFNFKSVCGADHQFTGMLEEFIMLADLI